MAQPDIVQAGGSRMCKGESRRMRQNDNALIADNDADTIDRIRTKIEHMVLIGDCDGITHPGTLLDLRNLLAAVSSLEHEKNLTPHV